MADWYVSNWGNDDNDGMSWATAKKTISGVELVEGTDDITYANGYFNEPSRLRTLICVPGTIFDGELLTDFVPDVQSLKLENVIIQNWRNFAPSNRYYREQNNVIVKNLSAGFCFGYSSMVIHKYCVIYNAVTTDIKQNVSSGYTKYNVTYAKLSNINFVVLGYSDVYYGLKDSIFQADFYYWEAPQKIPYCLFIGGDFQFTGGDQGADEISYVAPIGATDEIKIQNLKDRMAIVYGGLSDNYLKGCKFYSGPLTDILVDPENGDYNLVPFCIAAHMNFNGDYIGGRPEGKKLNWNTDWNNTTNIGSPGYVTDQNIDSTTESDIIDIGHVRTVLNFQSLGNRAARNGQQINTESNLSANISPGTSVLTDGSVYMCVDDTIALDDSGATPRIPWETFTAVDEGAGAGLGFTTEGVGTVKEVYTDDRYEPKIQWKSSKSDPTLAAAVLITSKLNSDPVMVNVDINGEPTLGDANVGYDSGTAVQLTAQYIKFFIKIKAWNLPART